MHSLDKNIVGTESMSVKGKNGGGKKNIFLKSSALESRDNIKALNTQSRSLEFI